MRASREKNHVNDLLRFVLLTEEDAEVSEYVKALEESKDAAEFKDVSGDEIARELERFLRRQNEN